MKILVIGSGGREHALIHKLSQSPKRPMLYAAPGNAGISGLATCVNIAVDNLEGLLEFAIKEGIDLTIVGPELPLVLGVVDLFEANGLRIFGPNKHAARFEGSKDFTKSFLIKHGIPTAHSETHTVFEAAKVALSNFAFPLVIKADGLAAGKGVVIAEDASMAEGFLEEIMCRKVFGESGEKVVIEQFLTGVEASILCFVDGNTILPMSPAQDYKKAMDGDLGLNTGGMGTYSPSKVIDAAMMEVIQKRILDPFIVGIKEDGIDFKGILFVGIMIEGDSINVLEYNVRMGDPETEVTLIRMENDLIDVIEAVENETLNEVLLKWSDQHAVCVILASGGYPESYQKGKPISGLEEVDQDTIVFHAGTKHVGERVVTDGGRVLGVTAMGVTLEQARSKAYTMAQRIDFEGKMFRTDIGKF